ncbi:MAG: hypothetical protein FJ139_06785, partial [Deltaproteobacteria bacterium]|nr:hypothetical protein [Deltaproteobacteria bacterium]
MKKKGLHGIAFLQLCPIFSAIPTATAFAGASIAIPMTNTLVPNRFLWVRSRTLVDVHLIRDHDVFCFHATSCEIIWKRGRWMEKEGKNSIHRCIPFL